MSARALGALALAVAVAATPLTPRHAAAEPREAPARLAVLPVVIVGPEGQASISDIYDAVNAASRLRPGLRLISSEEMFVASQDGLAERVRDCGPDTACIASRLRSFNARLGVVVVLNFQLAPPLVGVQLLDTDDVRELGRTSGELTTGEDLGNRLRAETSVLLDRAGFAEGGRLLVEVDPAAAQVVVQGQEPDRATPNLFVLPAGRYPVSASLAGYEPASTEGVVESGRETRLKLALDRSPSFLSSPWFWTAVGAVAVGAAVGAVLARPEPDTCFCFFEGPESSCDAC
jgi:hypothetical protein